MTDVGIVETVCEGYLEGISDARRAIRRLEQDRAEMRAAIDAIRGVRYDRVGGSPTMEHGDDAMFATIERLEEIERTVVEKANAYAETLSDWLYVRSQMPQLHADVLTMHYVEGMTWEAVALEVRYSERNVYRLRWDALLSLYELLQ